MFNLITIPSLPMDLLPTSYHPITYLITYNLHMYLSTYVTKIVHVPCCNSYLNGKGLFL